MSIVSVLDDEEQFLFLVFLLCCCFSLLLTLIFLFTVEGMCSFHFTIQLVSKF